ASLAEKLETLEQQVVGTVQNATSAVSDSVECVKDAVQETVDRAKTSVYDTVEAVKDTFDVTRQVREHPWLMMGGSVALGFASGYLLNRAGSTVNRTHPGRVPSLSTLVPHTGGPERDGGAGQPHSREALAPMAVPSPEKSLFGDLGRKFE